MAPMFADLLRAHPTLRRHVRPVTFFVQRPREANASRGRSFSTRLVASGRCHWWGAIRSIRVILLHPFPLFVCGAGFLRAGINDEGVFGCVGIGRISRIASEVPNRGSATSRDLLFNGHGKRLRPEAVHQEQHERP